MSYLRFAAMIATSTVTMFVLMYLNTYAWEHVFFSETRAYMAVLMGATMAIIMLAFMLGMYESRAVNAAIFIGSALVFALSLWLVRSQATVSGVSYMRAMIPHHSIAIMTSERAQITDPRVRKLADEIIEAQRREISEMRYLVADIEANGPAAEAETGMPGPAPEIVPLDEALHTLALASVDPEPVEAAEAAKAIGEGPACRFRRAGGSDPILVSRAGEGAPAAAVMKLHGKLVRLEGGDPQGGDAAVYAADGVRMTVRPLPEGEGTLAGVLERSSAELVFELDAGLTVGYRGFLACGA